MRGWKSVLLPWVQGSFQSHKDHTADCDESEDMHPWREKDGRCVWGSLQRLQQNVHWRDKEDNEVQTLGAHTGCEGKETQRMVLLFTFMSPTTHSIVLVPWSREVSVETDNEEQQRPSTWEWTRRQCTWTPVYSYQLYGTPYVVYPNQYKLHRYCEY